MTDAVCEKGQELLSGRRRRTVRGAGTPTPGAPLGGRRGELGRLGSTREHDAVAEDRVAPRHALVGVPGLKRREPLSTGGDDLPGDVLRPLGNAGASEERGEGGPGALELPGILQLAPADDGQRPRTIHEEELLLFDAPSHRGTPPAHIEGRPTHQPLDGTHAVLRETDVVNSVQLFGCCQGAEATQHVHHPRTRREVRRPITADDDDRKTHVRHEMPDLFVAPAEGSLHGEGRPILVLDVEGDLSTPPADRAERRERGCVDAMEFPAARREFPPAHRDRDDLDAEPPLNRRNHPRNTRTIQNFAVHCRLAIQSKLPILSPKAPYTDYERQRKNKDRMTELHTFFDKQLLVVK